jgi:demethoxyubiquinone hydroxylase (CLK1/Coq7/Cat5 family)
MKKTIFILTITTFMLGTLLTGCQSSQKKVENAEDNVQNAQNKLVDANQVLKQAVSDSIQQFKKESNAIIVSNDKEIAELRTKIINQRKENKARYEKKLGDLEQKNLEMRNKLDNFKDEEDSKWQSFKREFNHDMNELGNAIKDIGKNNTK